MSATWSVIGLAVAGEDEGHVLHRLGSRHRREVDLQRMRALRVRLPPPSGREISGFEEMWRIRWSPPIEDRRARGRQDERVRRRVARGGAARAACGRERELRAVGAAGA